MDGEGVEGDFNIFQKELVGSLVLGICWARVLTGSEEAIEGQSECCTVQQLVMG